MKAGSSDCTMLYLKNRNLREVTCHFGIFNNLIHQILHYAKFPSFHCIKQLRNGPYECTCIDLTPGVKACQCFIVPVKEAHEVFSGLSTTREDLAYRCFHVSDIRC